MASLTAISSAEANSPIPPRPAKKKTPSRAANLAKLLPTGPVLAFQTLSPAFTNKGDQFCHPASKTLTCILIFLCSLSCIFFAFTDTLAGADGNLYCGVATKKGFWAFNFGGTEEDKKRIFRDLGRMRVRLVDSVHAVLGLVVFLAMAFGDSDVESCLFSGLGMNGKALLANLPLGAGVFAALVFLIFPTNRKGIRFSQREVY